MPPKSAKPPQAECRGCRQRKPLNRDGLCPRCLEDEGDEVTLGPSKSPQTAPAAGEPVPPLVFGADELLQTLTLASRGWMDCRLVPVATHRTPELAVENIVLTTCKVLKVLVERAGPAAAATKLARLALPRSYMTMVGAVTNHRGLFNAKTAAEVRRGVSLLEDVRVPAWTFTSAGLSPETIDLAEQTQPKDEPLVVDGYYHRRREECVAQSMAVAIGAMLKIEAQRQKEEAKADRKAAAAAVKNDASSRRHTDPAASLTPSTPGATAPTKPATPGDARRRRGFAPIDESEDEDDSDEASADSDGGDEGGAADAAAASDDEEDEEDGSAEEGEEDGEGEEDSDDSDEEDSDDSDDLPSLARRQGSAAAAAPSQTKRAEGFRKVGTTAKAAAGEGRYTKRMVVVECFATVKPLYTEVVPNMLKSRFPGLKIVIQESGEYINDYEYPVVVLKFWIMGPKGSVTPACTICEKFSDPHAPSNATSTFRPTRTSTENAWRCCRSTSIATAPGSQSTTGSSSRGLLSTTRATTTRRNYCGRCWSF